MDPFTGLKYYDDLIQSVPREEAMGIKNVVVKEVSWISFSWNTNLKSLVNLKNIRIFFDPPSPPPNPVSFVNCTLNNGFEL